MNGELINAEPLEQGILNLISLRLIQMYILRHIKTTGSPAKPPTG
jgi:hypothetical protein